MNPQHYLPEESRLYCCKCKTLLADVMFYSEEWCYDCLNKLKKLCLRCDHEWFTKNKKPRVCPRCKDTNWNIKREEVNVWI